MRLGDASNISHGTRNSTSTLDDACSGRADAASSAGATSDGDSEVDDQLAHLPPPKLDSSPMLPPSSTKLYRKHLDEILPSEASTLPSGDDTAHDEEEYEDKKDDTFRPETHSSFVKDVELEFVKPKPSKAKTTSNGVGKIRTGGVTKATKVTKAPRPAGTLKTKIKVASAMPAPKVPISPSSMTSQSRKTSSASTLNFQHQLADDEEDLSSKPRCQRCRKSKKGCDRQRPCQRCKDAGIGIEGCISEDETNGRKGRYGRHMGVPVKKDTGLRVEMIEAPASILPPSAMAGSDKSKKRKR
jgi:hypothetical protein